MEGVETLDGFISNLMARASARQTERFRASFWEGNWEQYLVGVFEMPYLHLRTAFQLLRDAMTYFGIESVVDPLTNRRVKHLKIWDDPFSLGENRVVGQDALLEEFFDYVCAAAREEQIERANVFIGPPGIGKSKVIINLKNALREYTYSPEGVVCTIGFLFDEKFNLTKGTFGFTNNGDIESYAGPVHEKYADKSRADFQRIVCTKKDHPLLLLPKEDRQDIVSQIRLYHIIKAENVSEDVKRELSDLTVRYSAERNNAGLRREWESAIKEVGGKHDILSDLFMPRKLLHGDPCNNCQEIIKAVEVMYDRAGQRADLFNSVLRRHVEVRRVQFSEDKEGIATVREKDPNVHSEEYAPENEEHLLDAVPDASWRKFSGPLVKAHRGMYILDEMYLRTPAELIALFSLIQEQRAKVATDAQEDLDIIVVGDSNIGPFQEVCENDSLGRPLRERSRHIMMSYLTRRTDEEKIYSHLIDRISRTKRFEPHTVNLLTLFAVMTRIKEPKPEQYKTGSELMNRVFGGDRNLKLSDNTLQFVKTLDPVRKARMLDSDFGLFRSDERELLGDVFLTMLKREYHDEALDGMSPRHVQDILGELSHSSKQTISVFDVYDALKNLSSENFGIEAIVVGGNLPFKDPERLLALLYCEWSRITKTEVEYALTDYDRNAVVEMFERRYLLHVNAKMKKERIQNHLTKELENPDERFMSEMEGLLEIREKPEDYRAKLIRLYAGEAVSAGKEKRAPMPVSDFFAREIDTIRRNLYKRDAQNYVRFTTLRNSLGQIDLTDERWMQEQRDDSRELRKVRHVLKNMTKMQYSPETARRILVMHYDQNTIDL